MIAYTFLSSILFLLFLPSPQGLHSTVRVCLNITDCYAVEQSNTNLVVTLNQPATLPDLPSSTALGNYRGLSMGYELTFKCVFSLPNLKKKATITVKCKLKRCVQARIAPVETFQANAIFLGQYNYVWISADELPFMST